MKIQEWPLIFFTLLVEIAVGAFVSLRIYQGLTPQPHIELYRGLSLLGVLLVAAGLGVSLFHLGRPAHAYKAFYGVRNHAPLSWEVIATLLFFMLALIYSLLLHRRPLADEYSRWGLVVILAGLAAVLLSGRAYMLKSRPAWDSLATPATFLLTSFTTGPLLAGTFVTRLRPGLPGEDPSGFLGVVSAFLIAGLLIEGLVTHYHLKGILAGGEEARLTGRDILSSPVFRWRVAVGLVIPLVLGVFLAVMVAGGSLSGAGILIPVLLGIVLVGEFLSRAIFYSFSRQMDIGVSP